MITFDRCKDTNEPQLLIWMITFDRCKDTNEPQLFNSLNDYWLLNLIC